MIPNPSVTTAGGPAGLSPGSRSSRWLWPNVWDVCVGRAPLPSPAVVRFCPAWALRDTDPSAGECHQASHHHSAAQGRGAVGLHLRVQLTPASPLGLGCCTKLIQVPALGCHRAGLSPARLSPAASHRSPCPRASASQAGPATTSRTGFSEEPQHFCAQLLSPRGGRSGLGPPAAPLQGIWAGR